MAIETPGLEADGAGPASAPSSAASSRRFQRVIGGWLLAAVLVLVALTVLRSDAEQRWLKVERGVLSLSVPVEGTLKSVHSSTLSSPILEGIWQYELSYLTVEGAEVKAGDKVLEFDSRQILDNLKIAEANRDSTGKELEKRAADLEGEARGLELELAEAQARLRKARFALDVPEEVAARRELAKTRLDEELALKEIAHLEERSRRLAERRKSELGNLRQRRDRAAEKVETLRGTLDQMVVVAPRDGRVLHLRSRRDEPFKVGDNVWRGANVAEIPDLAELVGEGEVGEADLGRLQVGQAVTLRLDAHPDHRYRGQVSQIHRAVRPQSVLRPRPVIGVELTVDTVDPERMRPGMRFRGEIETASYGEVVRLPEAAIFHDRDGTHVLVKTLFGKRRVEPVLGRRNARYFEVVSGLEPGERILARGGAGS